MWIRNLAEYCRDLSLTCEPLNSPEYPSIRIRDHHQNGVLIANKRLVAVMSCNTYKLQNIQSSREMLIEQSGVKWENILTTVHDFPNDLYNPKMFRWLKYFQSMYNVHKTFLK